MAYVGRLCDICNMMCDTIRQRYLTAIFCDVCNMINDVTVCNFCDIFGTFLHFFCNMFANFCKTFAIFCDIATAIFACVIRYDPYCKNRKILYCKYRNIVYRSTPTLECQINFHPIYYFLRFSEILSNPRFLFQPSRLLNFDNNFKLLPFLGILSLIFCVYYQ